MRILQFVNSASSTSIPLEISERIHKETPAEVVVASFYDDSSTELDPDVEDFSVDIVPLGATSRFDFSAYRQLHRLISEGYDILHTHHNFTGSVARALATNRNVEIVNTEHNDHRYFTLAQNVSNAATLPLADAVVSNSEHTRDSFRWYERRLVPPEKHHVIYNGVDFERIQEGREMEAPIDLPDGPLVCNVGVATEQKDQDTLLKAMPSVLSEVPDASLVVVGDGPLLPDLKQTARELGITDSVVFSGYLPRREEVYSVLDRTDVFVVSSEYEGFCVALVEAMACETAVVASDIGVLREVAGDTCEFAAPGNPDEFAARIISLLQNRDCIDRLAEMARERANGKFRIELTAQGYYDVYSTIFA